MINEAMLFGLDQCVAKTGSLISLELKKKSTKMLLVDSSLCKIHLKGISMGKGSI